MSLTTAKNYLLLTERIGKKPMLRTRFTTQAYLILATLLDLRDQGVLTVTAGEMKIADQAKLAALPQYLDELKIRLQNDLQQDAQLKSALKLVTSWNIVNEIYDGIGAELERDGQVERVIFQNNLKPHVIYEPTDASRAHVADNLAGNIDRQQLTAADMNLWLLLRQQKALPYLFSDEARLAKLTAEFDRQTATDVEAATTQTLTETAGEIIQMKKFEMDGWLS
ncbi:hypothetical protein [Levilactobacillus fuyuanensis]|uniref:Uncharacterized protein n=1 Tax=Levilactobacillus fuyuanensis TaxID=2486022 RepID=A0ABW4H4K4_9LACO|nr:hypothetical protein [Levilactobacillus fuyuanensis]